MHIQADIVQRVVGAVKKVEVRRSNFGGIAMAWRLLGLGLFNDVAFYIRTNWCSHGVISAYGKIVRRRWNGQSRSRRALTSEEQILPPMPGDASPRKGLWHIHRSSPEAWTWAVSIRGSRTDCLTQ